MAVNISIYKSSDITYKIINSTLLATRPLIVKLFTNMNYGRSLVRVTNGLSIKIFNLIKCIRLSFEFFLFSKPNYFTVFILYILPFI